MMYAIAIDDEKNALDIVENYCQGIQDLELLGVFTDPEKGLDFVRKTPQVNLVFLDIRMANMNGIALAGSLPARARVIITTAFSDYAAMAFELDAVDYLMKPFSAARFHRALDKFRNQLHHGSLAEPSQTKKRLIPSQDDIILVRSDHKIIKINLNQLMYVEGAGNYVAFHTTSRKILALSTLKHVALQLAPYQFVRIHKSYLVSLSFIDSIEKNSVTVNGVKLSLSDGYKETLDTFLKESGRYLHVSQGFKDELE